MTVGELITLLAEFPHKSVVKIGISNDMDDWCSDEIFVDNVKDCGRCKSLTAKHGPDHIRIS